MESSFRRHLKALTSSSNKRAKFFRKLRLFQTCRSILVTKLHLFTEIDVVENHFNQFGTVEEAFYIHTDNLHYTKSCTVKMSTASSVSQIVTQSKHEIDDTHVKVERYHGTKDLQKLYNQGPYKLKIWGFDPESRVVKLVRDLESAFADVGRHSSMQLKKDVDGNLNGNVEVRFMTIEDGQAAQEIGINHGWDVQLFGPAPAV